MLARHHMQIVRRSTRGGIQLVRVRTAVYPREMQAIGGYVNIVHLRYV